MLPRNESRRPRIGLAILTVAVVAATGFGWYAVSDAWRHGLGAGVAATAVWGAYTVGIVLGLREFWNES